mmetsp:Transcript_30827/g.66349  ORF Transcript_30827/g.66349 Transcript_30827/m.66349 type:complete len:399 (+) Transcript_30827:71-1267(+)
MIGRRLAGSSTSVSKPRRNWRLDSDDEAAGAAEVAFPTAGGSSPSRGPSPKRARFLKEHEDDCKGEDDDEKEKGNDNKGDGDGDDNDSEEHPAGSSKAKAFAWMDSDDDESEENLAATKSGSDAEDRSAGRASKSSGSGSGAQHCYHQSLGNGQGTASEMVRSGDEPQTQGSEHISGASQAAERATTARRGDGASNFSLRKACMQAFCAWILFYGKELHFFPRGWFDSAAIKKPSGDDTVAGGYESHGCIPEEQSRKTCVSSLCKGVLPNRCILHFQAPCPSGSSCPNSDYVAFFATAAASSATTVTAATSADASATYAYKAPYCGRPSCCLRIAVAGTTQEHHCSDSIEALRPFRRGKLSLGVQVSLPACRVGCPENMTTPEAFALLEGNYMLMHGK